MAALNAFIAFIPFLCLFGIILLAINKSRDHITGLIAGVTVWSLLVWLATNALSWFNLVYGNLLAVFWFVCLNFVIFLCIRWKIRFSLKKVAGWQWAIVIICSLTLLTAIAYPPNNYDVLTYHMPRVEHWLQNHSLAPWPTSIDRQIGMAPFNAMIVLQTYGPSRCDLFVNLPQWLAFAGCLALIGQIAMLLGGGRVASICAMIFAATLPSAIIQASNTDSCLIVSFYLCAMVYIWLEWRKAENFFQMLLLGANLGLAILSKGSAYPVSFPFVCMIAFGCFRHPRKLLVQGMAAAILVCAINAPHLWRTMNAEGNIIASAERNVLKKPTPATFVVNSVYNFVSNQPVLLSHGGKEVLERFASSLGIEQDNRDIFPWGGLDFAKSYYAPSDSVSANPFQSVFLVWISIAILLEKFRPPWYFTGTVAASFALFSLVLTWHPWVSRIHIPLFFLAAPLCGLFLQDFRHNWLRQLCLGLACFCAIWPVFLCVERPLAPPAFVDLYRHNVRHFATSPREMLLFNNTPPEAGPYTGAIDYLAERNPGRIGLRLGNNGWEYPLWALLGNRLTKMPVIEHVLTDLDGDLPEYIFEFSRNDTDAQEKVRVIRRENGRERIVYPEAE